MHSTPQSEPPVAAPPATPSRWSRRRFLRRIAGAALVAGSGTALYAWQVEPFWTEYVRRDLPIAHLPDRWVGRTIVQLSDLHIGRTAESHIAMSVERVNALAPDLIVITGDFMSCRATEHVNDVARLLAPLRAKLGVFGIPGNHDYGSGWKQRSTCDALQTALAGVGIPLLRNEVAEVDGVQIVGIDDLWGTNFDPAAAWSRADLTKPTLCLCHNPDACDHPVWGGYRGWILSGHTHGGQCKSPFLPPPMLPVANRRYVAGAYDVGGGRTLYINRGLGYILQARFNVRPEVTVFTLARA
jgi:predicted MPP superfamily phosphohydrolase